MKGMGTARPLGDPNKDLLATFTMYQAARLAAARTSQSPKFFGLNLSAAYREMGTGRPHPAPFVN